MEINTAIYGDSTQWLYDDSISYSPTASSTTDTDLIFYCGKHRRIDSYSELEINKPIDYSICYCAHAAAEKMPLADIAAVDYQGNVVATQTENNAWFMISNSNVSTARKDTLYLCNALALAANETTPTTRSNATRWYPKAAVDGYSGKNTSAPMRPIVSFPLRGFYGAIRVEISHKTNKNDYLNIWLKDLENDIDTYKDNYYINSAYLRFYAYTGGGKSNTSYSDFALKNAIAWGAGFNKPMKIGTQNLDVLSYSWASRSSYNLPIFGTLGIDGHVGGSSYTKYYGTPVYPYDYSTYGDQRGNDCAAILYGYSWGEVKEVLTTKNDGGYTVYCLRFGMDITAENIEKIRQGAAAYGIFFTDYNPETLKTDAKNNTRWYNDKMCLGVLDDDNIGHGEYTRGINNVKNKIWDYTNSTDSTYNPNANIDPNTYSDTTKWNNVDFRQSFTKRYLLNSSQVTQLAAELWAAQSSKPADIDYNNFAIDEYLTNNPIDTIVSLKYFPCTFADQSPAIVHLGKYTTNIAATALGTSVRIIDFAPIECFPHFNDFRDYEPCTELAMYVPFCGTVKIPTAECMGNYVSVKLAIDTNTGAATGYIIVSKTGTGGICVATCQGMAAIDIPVSGLQSANLANAVFNATANWTQTQVNNISANSGLFKNMGGAIGTLARGMADSVSLSDLKGGILGGPLGAISTLANSLNPISALQRGTNIEIENAKADYELSHIQVPTRLVGSASPALGCVIELDCRLIIYRPVTDESAISNYADTVGYATLQGGTVGQFSGFTVGTIDVSGINATAKEKQAIAAAFANGVYL